MPQSALVGLRADLQVEKSRTSLVLSAGREVVAAPSSDQSIAFANVVPMAPAGE